MTLGADDIIRVTAKMRQGSDDIQNVFHFKNTGIGGAEDDDVMTNVAAWMDGVYDNIDALQGNAHTYESIDVYNVTDAAPIGEIAWPTLTVGGDSTADEYAKQVAGLIRFTTNVAKSQGRKFIGGLTEAGFDSGGLLTSAVQTALAAMASDILEEISWDTVNLLVGNWNPTLSRFVPWVEALVNAYGATQRRRATGVGS